MKIAVLGAGGMGGGIWSTLKDHPLVNDIVMVDNREECVRMWRTKHKAKATTDLQSVLADPEVRLVFVTASNGAHKPLCLAAFEAGKAVMCEKPIATTLQDSLEMVEMAERKKLFFQIGFELRYSKLYTTVKDWIDAGLLGQVVNTQYSYYGSEFHGKGSWRNKKETGGSMFGEKLCHYVDLPRWWIGSEVTEVHSICAPNVVPYFEVHDNYHTLYRFANGAVCSLSFVMYAAHTFDGDPLMNVVSQQQGDGHQLTYLIVGTKGAAATDVFHRTLKRWEFGDSPKCMTSKLVETRTWEAAEDQRYFHDGTTQTLDIVRRVHEGLPPATPARDAYETMRVVFAAEKSADEGRAVRMDEV